MRHELTCTALVEFMGERLQMNKVFSNIELHDIMPPRDTIVDISDMWRLRETQERRQRLIDMIASEFAHSLTEALFKKARG